MLFIKRTAVCGLYLLFILLSTLVETSSAVTLTWTGGGASNLASNAANWSGNVVPQYGDGIVFDGTSTKDCTWDFNETLSSFSITPAYSGTVTQNAILKVVAISSLAPNATTGPATNKNGNSATLNATVNPNGLTTSVYFEWGTSSSYGNITPTQAISAGTSNVAVTANITGLSISTTYHYRVVAVNSAGTSTGVDVAFATPSIAITITSPADGSTIFRPDVMVRGTITTTGVNETGVTVNGAVAMVYSDQFVINHVPLTDGANTITVTTTDTAGNTATTSIAVTAVMSGPYVTLTANTESGTSPLMVNFSASTAIPNVVATYKIDYDGDGTDDYSGFTFDNISHTYSSPGIYFATLTIVDSSAISYTDTIVVVVLDWNTLDGSLINIWNSMKAKLIIKDVNGGTNFMSGSTRNIYQQALNSIVDDLPQIIANMQTIELIYATGDLAKYRINRLQDIDGTQVSITYYIYFAKNADGLWKVREF